MKQNLGILFICFYLLMNEFKLFEQSITNNKIKKLDGAFLKYSNKKFNEWTWLVSHNSPLNWADNNVIYYASNQNASIDQQLNFGVRGFMLDIDFKRCDDFEKLFNNCNCEGVCLCHGECDGSAFEDGFSIKNLEYALRKFTSFLNKNRNEIICIFLENYVVDTKLLQNLFNRVKHFNSYVFNPYSSEWNVLKKGWPKITDMIKANKRLLIFDDEKRGRRAGERPGFIRNRDYMLENHYEWFDDSYEWIISNKSVSIPSYLEINQTSNLTLDLSRCFSLHKIGKYPVWNETNKLISNQTEHKDSLVNSEKLFFFNHFYGVAANEFNINPITVQVMNNKDFILERLRKKCDPGTNRKRPNFIALDFVTNNIYKDLIEPLNANIY